MILTRVRRGAISLSNTLISTNATWYNIYRTKGVRKAALVIALVSPGGLHHVTKISSSLCAGRSRTPRTRWGCRRYDPAGSQNLMRLRGFHEPSPRKFPTENSPSENQLSLPCPSLTTLISRRPAFFLFNIMVLVSSVSTDVSTLMEGGGWGSISTFCHSSVLVHHMIAWHAILH